MSAFVSAMQNTFKNPFSKKKDKKTSEHTNKIVAFLNKYSLIFHAVFSCVIVFLVELLSRRELLGAWTFVNCHTKAFLYNAFVVFCSYSLVYLFRRRTFTRFIITGFWLFLGTINGCILANRVTPFGYTDIKCLSELFAMTDNTHYFTGQQVSIAIVGLISFVVVCVLLFIKGPKYAGKMYLVRMLVAVVALLVVVLPATTVAAQNTDVLSDYFANIAQGYENYGFIYGFSCSVLDRGMSKPASYNKNYVDKLVKRTNKKAKATSVTAKTEPNIICILLESFCDPEEIKFLSTNEDPIPTFHELEENFSTGYLTVPVVGAGTANSEFEVLTGMSMDYFGTGEYPYKTILKKRNCESVASNLSNIGYSTHVVHNNGGNFYSRVNAFSMFGFDSFTSKEMMNIREYTPNGSWATDGIMVGETIKAMDSTPDQADFTYVITVGTHGDYPKERVIDEPPYTVKGLSDEETSYQWEYYVNQLNEVDTFVKDLLTELEKRDEDTIVVCYGDHLPTLGLQNKDMVSGDIYKTKYVTWNNMGLKKKDADMEAFQLLASVMDSVDIHEGTIFKYHQTQQEKKDYLRGLENLQYDILYGKRYCYDGGDPYPATDIVMGIDEVVLSSMTPGFDGNRIFVRGEHFTKWSKVYVNGKKVPTTYISDEVVAIKSDSAKDGDTVVVCQVGSEESIFRSSNKYVYVDVTMDHKAKLKEKKEN